jgi:phage terminase small subunit
MALTPKQARNVDEYHIDLNATQDAIRAGYSATNADVTGPRLLGNVGVAAAVTERQAKVAEKHGITLDSHLETLASLRDGAKSAEQYAAAITAETTRGKVAGLYVDKVEHSGKNGGPIQVWQFGKRKVTF